MYEFEYRAPNSIDEVSELMRGDPDAKPLSGGMSLLSAMKLRLNAPSMLIDLSRIEALRGIHVEEGVITIGATTRHAVVAASEDVRRHIPALADLAGGIGDRQVRNRGTIGGSLANCDPAACYPSSVMALGASIVTSSRTIPADAFFVGLFQTALGPDEVLTAVRFPIPRRAAYVKFVQPASRFALVGVMAAQHQNGEVRIGVTGAKSHAYRERALEAVANQRLDPAVLRKVCLEGEDYNDDIHADAEYRRHLVVEIASRAVEKMLNF